MKKMWLMFFGLFVFVFLLPKVAFAFGPGVHLELALKFLEGGLLPLPAKGALGLAFLYGNLAPDYFVSSATLKALWHREEAFLSLLRQAQSPEERAFSLGFGAHLAADRVAHEELIPALRRRLELPERLIHYYFEWTLERNRATSWYLLRGLLLWPGHRELEAFLTRAFELEPRRFMTRKWVSLSGYRLFKLKRRLPATSLAVLFERRFRAARPRCLEEMAAYLEPLKEARCGSSVQGP